MFEKQHITYWTIADNKDLCFYGLKYIEFLERIWKDSLLKLLSHLWQDRENLNNCYISEFTWSSELKLFLCYLDYSSHYKNITCQSFLSIWLYPAFFLKSAIDARWQLTVKKNKLLGHVLSSNPKKETITIRRSSWLSLWRKNFFNIKTITASSCSGINNRRNSRLCSV